MLFHSHGFSSLGSWFNISLAISGFQTSAKILCSVQLDESVKFHGVGGEDVKYFKLILSHV